MFPVNNTEKFYSANMKDNYNDEKCCLLEGDMDENEGLNCQTALSSPNSSLSGHTTKNKNNSNKFEKTSDKVNLTNCDFDQSNFPLSSINKNKNRLDKKEAIEELFHEEDSSSIALLPSSSSAREKESKISKTKKYHSQKIDSKKLNSKTEKNSLGYTILKLNQEYNIANLSNMIKEQKKKIKKSNNGNAINYNGNKSSHNTKSSIQMNDLNPSKKIKVNKYQVKTKLDDIITSKINKNHINHRNILATTTSSSVYDEDDDILNEIEENSKNANSSSSSCSSSSDSDSDSSISKVCSCHDLIDLQSLLELAYEDIDPRKMTRAQRFSRWIQLSGPCEMFFFGIVVAFSAFHIALNHMTRDSSNAVLIALIFQCIVMVLSCMEAGLRVTLLWDFLPVHIRSSRFLMVYYILLSLLSFIAASLMINRFFKVKFVGLAAGLFSLPIGFLYFTIFLKSARKLIIYGNKPLIKFPM